MSQVQPKNVGASPYVIMCCPYGTCQLHLYRTTIKVYGYFVRTLLLRCQTCVVLSSSCGLLFCSFLLGGLDFGLLLVKFLPCFLGRGLELHGEFMVGLVLCSLFLG